MHGGGNNSFRRLVTETLCSNTDKYPGKVVCADLQIHAIIFCTIVLLFQHLVVRTTYEY
jgi:hypothetical protein